MTPHRRYTVFAGQFLITSVPALLTTVLGSCIAICLWDRENHIGGINHFLLPGTPDDDTGDPTRGLAATHMLVRSMLNRRVKLENLEAKVFGGCNSLYKSSDVFRIGKRNSEIALEVLDHYSIPVVAQHVGGGYGRKIVFNTATGKVRMRLLTETAAEVNEKIKLGFGY
jgi:chemotaxis protein CheD